MNTKVVVLKEITLKEEDKIVVVFSREYGKISVYAKGARKTKSAFLAGTQMLTYSDFLIYKKDNLSNLSKIEIIDSFMDIKNDYNKLYYAMYFAEFIDAVTIEDNPCREIFDFLIMTLNKLKTNKDIKLIKAIFELKVLGLAGYMPNIVSCQSCDNEISDEDVYFDVKEDGIICMKCNLKKREIKLSKTTLFALKYIYYADADKLYSFSLDEEFKNQLIKVANDYKNSVIEKPFKTEKFLY